MTDKADVITSMCVWALKKSVTGQKSPQMSRQETAAFLAAGNYLEAGDLERVWKTDSNAVPRMLRCVG